MAGLQFICFTTLSFVLSLFLRNFYVLVAALLVVTIHSAFVLLPWLNPRSQLPSRKQGSPTRLMIVLGSGGHTSEMLSLIRDLDCRKYNFRSYVVSSGDDFSVERANNFEMELSQRFENHSYGAYDVTVIPRARRVHQPLITTPWTALQCLVSCFQVLRAPTSNDAVAQRVQYPSLILSNGPGTGVIVMLAALILQLLGLAEGRGKGVMRMIYVESWARVKRLSLSGKILVHFVDRFIVQWESLLPAAGSKGEYRGTLIT